MKLRFVVILVLFILARNASGQTGCDLAAIRAAFAAKGHYSELTVSGQPCSMYFINTKSQDADVSEQEAQQLGAHMAVFNNAAENTDVVNALNSSSYSGNIWIGYKRSAIAAATFYAMDATTGNFTPGAATATLYQNWASGEPNNSGYQTGPFCLGNAYACANGEMCTQVYTDAKWNDLPCNSSSISIVEVNLCPTTTVNANPLTICGGGSVDLPTTTILGSQPYTYTWSSNPAGFTSSVQSPSAMPSANTTYSVEVRDRYQCLSTAGANIQVVPTIATITGSTKATCKGACDGTATASASGGIGSGAFSYKWSTSPIQTTATATGLCAGTYTCTATKADCTPSGTELVNNSNFNSGNTGFSSTYSYVADGAGTTELNPEGKYSILTGNASQVHGSFTGTAKGGSGSFMVINGSSTANVTVWCQSINVIANTDYEFSTWISSVHPTNPASLQFSFNGVNTGSINAPGTTNNWVQFFSKWNSGTNTSVNICLVNQNTNTSGNDFALDDISFRECVPGCQDTAIVVITEDEVIVPPLTPATICANGNASLTASPTGGTGTYTYTWLPAGTGNTATVNVSPSNTSIYTVTATDGNNCTSSPQTVTVNVNNNLNVTVNSVSLCYGETATLTANGASNYAWAPATDLSATNGATVTSSPTSTITYTITGTSGSCVGTATATVTATPFPSSDAGADITLCSGTTGNIGAPGRVGYVYSWNPGADLSSATDANPSVSPVNYSSNPVTVTYVVTTSPAGCFSKDTVNVTVNPSLDPTFNYSSSTFCKSGGSSTATPTINATGGAFTSSPTGLSINGSTGVIDIASSTVGTYTVTYSHNTACPSSSNQVVTITNNPNANFTYGSYCVNEANPLPAFDPGASAGTFISSTGLVFVDNTTGEINLSASTPGAYTITNTVNVAGCTAASATNTISINAIPAVAVNNATICFGQNTVLTASGANSYLWSDNTSNTSITVSPISSTNYSVTGTSNGCSATAVAIVFVNSLPVVSISDATICTGQTATLTAVGATSYIWQGGSTGNTATVSSGTTFSVTGTTNNCSSTATANITINSIPDVTVNSPFICSGNSATLTAAGANSYLWSTTETTNPITVTPTALTSYTVTGTTNGCSKSVVAAVTITPLPDIKVNPASICFGQSVMLNASGGSTYNWSTGTTGNSISVSPNSTTTYTVSDNTPGCSGSTTVTVTVYQLPIIQINSATTCAGDRVVLTASGATLYLWSNNYTLNPLPVSPLTTTTYSITGTTLQGCTGTGSTTVTVNPLPIITVNAASICRGEIATLTATGAVSYVWSTNAPVNTITVTPIKTTQYTVTGTGINNCVKSETTSVTVFPRPTAQFSSSPNPAKQLSPLVNFYDESSTDVITWFWDFGDGTTDNTQSPSHLYPSDTATYTATLVVSNIGLCFDTVNHQVIIGPEFSFYIPNAFTPDNDGKNDVFYGQGQGILEYQLMIFNRWGEFIFVSDDINKGWDGMIPESSTELSKQDVYVWKVKLTDVFKKAHNYTGTVTLLRGE